MMIYQKLKDDQSPILLVNNYLFRKAELASHLSYEISRKFAPNPEDMDCLKPCTLTV